MGELKALLDYVPTVIDHIQSKNIIALIADLNTVKPHIDNIEASCVKDSSDCNSFQDTLLKDLNALLGDIESNAAKEPIEGHAKGMADDLYNWRQTCFNQ